MADEDDRFGLPTHTCKFCSRGFSATWEYFHNGKRLIVDLLSGGESISAAKQGCCFYQEVLSPIWPASEDIRVTLQIERKSYLGDWDDIELYLEAKGSSKKNFATHVNMKAWSENLGLPFEPLKRYDVLSVFLAAGQTTGDPWFDEVVPPPNLNMMSTQATTQMRTWLAGCTTKHERSSVTTNTVSKFVMPKRLLKVEPNNEIVYLSELTQTREYALLSYCWGGDQSTKTTMTNLTSHKQGIRIETLPCTIRDAIQVTKDIGLEYLWVDALCIVQDDSDEVTQEIANQADIYQNGAVTILAGGAASADEGFLSCRPRTQPRYNISIHLPDCKEIHLLLDVRRDLEDVAEIGKTTDPVNRRAWILQEVLLSPNLLYFSSTQLVFFCESSVHADGGVPIQLFSYRHSAQYLRSSTSGGRLRECSNSSSNLWHEIVRMYSKLELSESTDKLLAIAAVAEAISGAFLDHNSATGNYKAGLWQQHMPLNLLWYRVYAHSKPRPAYRAPSWSWASIDSGVLIPGHETLSGYHPDRYTSKVLHVETQLASKSAPYGQVLSGKLRIEGLVKDIQDYWIDDQRIRFRIHDSREESYSFDATKSESDFANLDPLESHPLISILCIIRLPRNQDEASFGLQGTGTIMEDTSWHVMYGLILRREKADEETYMRIGRFELPTRDPLADLDTQRWQDSFQKRAITIV